MSIPLSRRGFVASLGLGAVVASIPAAMVRRLRAEEATMVEPMPKAPTVPAVQTFDTLGTPGSDRAMAMLEAQLNVQLAFMGYRLTLYGSPDRGYVLGEVMTTAGERVGERFQCQLTARPADLVQQIRFATARCIDGHEQMLMSDLMTRVSA